MEVIKPKENIPYSKDLFPLKNIFASIVFQTDSVQVGKLIGDLCHNWCSFIIGLVAGDEKTVVFRHWPQKTLVTL